MNTRPRLCLAIGSLLLAGSGLLFTPTLRAATRIVDLRPHWDAQRPLANPHKGWYHHFPDNHIDKYTVARDEDLTEFPGMDHVYLRLAWAYLEPAEGQFNWQIIDEMIEQWTGYGMGIAFRISCRETSTDRIEQQFATPRWVIEAGANGGHFLRGNVTGPEGPWEPDFADPIFLEKLDQFLAAFAARYDGKPWLRYVDVGSIGDWGEGHTHSGSRTEYGFKVRKQHVDLHLRYFRQSQIVVTDDFVYAIGDPLDRERMHQYVLANGISYRDDSILVNGYLSSTSDRFTVRSPDFFADAYPTRPTVFELEHYSAVKRLGNWSGAPGSDVANYGKGKLGPDYFRGALGLLGATFIGYHGYADEWLRDNPELTIELLNRCGYWYFPRQVELPETIKAGERASITITWENRGVAPAYNSYCLFLRLSGPREITQSLSARNRRWLPSGHRESTYLEGYPLKPAKNLPSGSYTLSFKLYSPQAKRDVLLPLNRSIQDASGFHMIGTVKVTRP